uniref:Solute carrier organic anion transporter family member n=1 Tax=Strigamia maritima TaxID=126957 RepID=T1J4Q6_STRMM
MADTTVELNHLKPKVNKLEKEKAEQDLDIHPDYLCGIGACKPKWMQKLAHRNVYMISYCILNMCQGMFYTYMISILSTVERRFAVPSKVTGFIMTGNEFSSIIAAIPVAYFGSQGHKPRWIAMGMFVSACAAFIIALPEFVIPGNEALLQAYTNSSSKDVCQLNDNNLNLCEQERSTNSFTAMALIFIGLFVYGLGTLPMYSLGYTYIDDNVPKKTMPAYLGVSMGLRVIGPSVGYMLGGIFLKMYHDLEKTPDFGPKDPRWIGAWWLGFFVIGCCIVLSSSFILLFPRELTLNGEKPTLLKKKKKLTEALNLPSIKDFPSAIKRVLNNNILIALTFEANFYLLGIVGFGTFMPKYLEAQFGQSASTASIITGSSTSVAVMIIGLVSSGFIIKYFKPRPRVLSGYSIFLGVLHFVTLIVCMNIVCEEIVIIEGNFTADNLLQLSTSCNADCLCTTEKFTPVCDQSLQQTYFSACYAGCTTYNASSKSYSNCNCVDSSLTEEALELGKCPTDCNAFIWYVAIMTAMRFLLSTERVGSTLIYFRCIDPKDKSLALGWLNSVLCLFAFLPCTIIYGAVVDSTCIVWEESCGERGNCWVYDVDKLRKWLHGITAGLLITSQLFQCYVWYKCKDLKLYEEIAEKEENDKDVSLPLKENSQQVES